MESQVPNQPIVPSAPSTIKPSNHLTIIVMAIFILMCLGSVIFLFYQNQQLKKMLAGYQVQNSPSPTPTATTDPKSDWKTYTNEEYKFSFKYPTDFKYIKEQENITTDNGYKNLLIIQNFPISMEPNYGSEATFQMVISTKKNDTKTLPSKNIFVGNELILRFENTLNKTGNENVFDQILSTFKFLDNKTNIPLPISSIFDSINQKFNTNLTPVVENKFETINGKVDKNSWKIDFIGKVADQKSIATFLSSILKLNFDESAAGGVGGLDTYENIEIKCVRYFGYKTANADRPSDPYDYLSCALK